MEDRIFTRMGYFRRDDVVILDRFTAHDTVRRGCNQSQHTQSRWNEVTWNDVRWG